MYYTDVKGGMGGAKCYKNGLNGGAQMVIKRLECKGTKGYKSAKCTNNAPTIMHVALDAEKPHCLANSVASNFCFRAS